MGHALLLIYDPNHAMGINARRQQRVLEVCVLEIIAPILNSKCTYSICSHPTQVQVAHHAHIICGICLSNPTSETRRTACYAMFLCCRYITNPMEQLAILDMLKQTEIEDQWPTARISQVLKEEWDIIG